VDEFEQVFRGSFQVKYLQKFLSGMERQIITMKVSTGKPLYIKYHIGSERSFVCLVLSYIVDPPVIACSVHEAGPTYLGES
jgi:hypothetical protein